MSGWTQGDHIFPRPKQTGSPIRRERGGKIPPPLCSYYYYCVLFPPLKQFYDYYSLHRSVNVKRDPCLSLRWVYSAPPTLSVGGVSRVDVQRLLALSDGGSQWQVGVHHPLLVVAVDDRFRGHGQRVSLGHVLGQRG